jgi:DinB family protein
MPNHDVEDLARRFAAGPAALRAAWARVPADARQWRPAPGKWSAHEVVLHCADAAVNTHARMRYLLAENDPVIVAYDQDGWATALDYHAHPVDLAFGAIDAIIANTLPMVRTLTPAQFARSGRHTEVGPITLGSWIEYYADHLTTHARQIDRNVAAFRAKG